MKHGDIVKTIYGDIDHVLEVLPSQVTTYESFMTLRSYQPTKVNLYQGFSHSPTQTSHGKPK